MKTLIRTAHNTRSRTMAYALLLASALLTASTSSIAQQHIATHIKIQAEPHAVWAVLTQFKKYPNWSAFIETINTIDGQPPQVGSQLSVSIAPPTEGVMVFTPELLKYDVNKELRWRGNVAGMDILFAGEHYFKLTKTADQHTLLTHGEVFSGWLLPLLWGSISNNTPQGFNDFNKAIKQQAELISGVQ